MSPNKILDDLIAAGVPSDTILAVAEMIAQAKIYTEAENRRAKNAERMRSARVLHSARTVLHSAYDGIADTSITKEINGKQTMSVDPVVSPIPPENPAVLLSYLLPFSNSLTEGKKAKEEVVARRKRGTRLPDNWCLSEALVSLCRERNVVPQDFETEFKDYWIAVPGARGCKLDWEATARNRIREIGKRQKVKTNGNFGIGAEIRGSPGGDRARELAAIARQRELEAGIGRPTDAFRGPRSGQPDD